ncbi:MAG: SpoIVB peptidase [Ruminococcus sp.]|nr:SpoIVB peptidase [Ruminococcus sp.]
MQKLNFKKFVATILVLLLTTSLITVNAESNNKKVILGGTPFGLKLFTNGVIVIEVSEDNSPAKDSGIKVNDLIVKANDNSITSNEQFKSIVENSFGNAIKLTIMRDKNEITKNIVPKKDQNNNYILGMWIRDSTAGIGTVTYFDPENETFAALGHGICDKDTNLLMPIRNGEIMSATISNCTKGSQSSLGGLNGYFENDKIGEITVNNGFGIYGKYDYTDNTRYIEVAKNNEIDTGEASIISTIEGKTPKEYKIEIVKLNMSQKNGQNMILKVKDEELINKTGGIVQGMSGSPIIQNGKLVGAVTHVFVNSPEKGYGISITNMLNNTNRLASKTQNVKA